MDSVLSPPLTSGRSVLVIEDELRVRTMLSQALKEMGFTATLTSTAESGAKALAQQDFDILILDLNLPGIGGIDFLESLRKEHRELQVIILTGFGDLDAARKAIHLDVVEFLTKPCALGDLEVALGRARDRRRAQIVGIPAAGVSRSLQFEPAPKTRQVLAGGSAPPQADANPEGASMEELEQRHILSILQKQNGNRAATAAELGISLRKLYYRLGEYQKKGLIS
jgi:DNA-binding NtrC family response regulator